MLNRICFAVELACIAAGVVASLAIIWLPVASDVPFKAFLSIGVLFLAAAMVQSVNKWLN